MAFIQDPRLRQRWNRISHNAEAVTENAAAGIWTFQHRYLNPCLAGLGEALDGCTAVCIGDREERARRARERDRGAHRTRAEYMFDFYDDWDEADDEDGFGGSGSGSNSGILGSWGGGRREDWDRLLAGTGSGRGGRYGGTGTGDVVDHQPRRKRGMSYGTRGPRRKASGGEDPTIIPSTAPLGFLGRLPFKIGGTLRYKPSAANLRDHPGASIQGNDAEHEPLLGMGEDDDLHPERSPMPRPRSNTAGSGDTSDSFRSRGDLFPSDEEGDEDAVPLDDEFAVALDRVEADRASNRTKSSKGKWPADKTFPRTDSRTTMSSTHSRDSKGRASTSSLELPPPVISPPSLEDLQKEEEAAEREEHERLERKRKAASQLAAERGLRKQELETSGDPEEDSIAEVKADVHIIAPLEEHIEPTALHQHDNPRGPPAVEHETVEETKTEPAVTPISNNHFVPARLPHFR